MPSAPRIAQCIAAIVGILTSTLAFSDAKAPGLSLEEFLQKYIEESPSLKESQSRLSESEWLQRAESGWSTVFEAGAESTRLKARPQSSPAVKGSQVKGVLRLASPTGTQLNLETGQQRSSQQGTQNTSSHYLGIELRQELLTNAFGRSTRSLYRELGLRFQAARWDLKSTQQAVCLQGIELFALAYSSQESLKLRQELYNEALRLKSELERLFRERLIRQATFLGSQSDLIDQEAAFRSFESAHSQRLELLSLYSAIATQNTQLIAPQPLVERLHATADFSPDKAGTFAKLESAKLQRQAAELSAQRLKWQRLPSLNAVAALRRSDGTTVGADPSLYPSANPHDRYFLGLELSLPLWEPRSRSQAQAALSRLQAASAAELAATQAASVTLIDLKSKIEQNSIQQKALSERNAIQERQSRLLREDLRNARIEFEEYLAFRNRMAQTRFESLALEAEALALLSHQAVLSKQHPLCQELDQ